MPFRHFLKCETMPCTSEQFELMTLCKEVMMMNKVQNVLCMSLHGNQSPIEFKTKDIRRKAPQFIQAYSKTPKDDLNA